MKPSEALSRFSVLLSFTSIVLGIAGISALPTYLAAISFIMAATSLSLSALILSMVALVTSLVPLGNDAISWLAITCSLALAGLIIRLILSDVRGYTTRNFVVGSIALIIGMPLAIALPLLSRSLTVIEPLAVTLVSAIASYALGISYAVGRGLRSDVAPIGLRWLREFSKQVFSKFVWLLTWLVLTALITRALAITGTPTAFSALIAVFIALPVSLIAGRHRLGLPILLTVCAAASVVLLRREDVTAIGNTLRFIEEVVRYLAW